jgi:phospho-N-acetylmuramoyl-pentapeptide-transferase
VLFLLGELLQQYFGPFRLLTSRLFLGSLSLLLSWLLAFLLLPRLMNRLPRDRGRAHAVQSAAAQGKPTGAGIIFVTTFIFVQILVQPPTYQVLAILGLLFLAMMSGWLDDKAPDSWGEYKKGIIDLLLAAVTCAVLCEMKDTAVWLPFTKLTLTIPPWLFIPAGTILIWTAINSTNCTDGVDGLSGTLSAFAFACIGGMLYFILGHADIANYLLLPHYPDGATWGIMAFSMVGTLIGYLWYNAHPSVLLMGDAGSRALGFLLGVLVIKTGNPFIIFIVSGVLLINGGTGLVKVALLRFAKIAIFRTVRFPLHDHVRHNKGWSNPQVLVRFAVLQVMISLVMMVLLIKVR